MHVAEAERRPGSAGGGAPVAGEDGETGEGRRVGAAGAGHEDAPGAAGDIEAAEVVEEPVEELLQNG